jgi:biopolymer transport protein ExbD
MNLRAHRKLNRDREFSLDMTSLIDVVLLLLIFFMMTANFESINKMSLKLPSVEQDYDQAINLKELTITVTKEGGYFINGRALTNNYKKTLSTAVTMMVADQDLSKIQVVINGDASAPHQAIVTALDALGELNISNVKIAVANTDHKAIV